MKQKLKNLWNYFTTYEKIWFISITVLAFVFAILFPEEDFGGVNGKVIMALYLLDIFLNITCEPAHFQAEQVEFHCFTGRGDHRDPYLRGAFLPLRHYGHHAVLLDPH